MHAIHVPKLHLLSANTTMPHFEHDGKYGTMFAGTEKTWSQWRHGAEIKEQQIKEHSEVRGVLVRNIYGRLGGVDGI